MARTVNRQPFSVSTSLANQDQFFNQIEWKGMSDDKNFLTSDPETFESCKNVYVDAEGLLRSRPALKVADQMNVVNFWSLGQFVLVLSKTNENRYDLYVSNVNDERNATTVGTDLFYIDEKVKPLQIEDKIFLLSPNSFRYINTKTLQIADAQQFIYTPETKVYTSSVAQKESESKNLLTDDEIFTYIYDTVEKDANVDFMLGRDLYFTMLDKTYTVKFNSLTPLTLLKKLPVSMTSTNCMSFVFSRTEYDSIALVNPDTRQFLYSNDGSVWNIAKTIPGDLEIVGAGFTQDGFEFYCNLAYPINEITHVEQHDFYIISVEQSWLSGELNGYRFQNFTNLSRLIDLPPASSSIDLISWNRGVTYVSNPETKILYVFLSEDSSNAKSFSVDSFSSDLGKLHFFMNISTGKHLVCLSQGFRGSISYLLFDDDFTGTVNSLSFPGSSGNQQYPDDLRRVGTGLVFTYWNGNMLTQYNINASLESALLYEYSVAKSEQLAVNSDASALMTPTHFCKDGIISELLETPSKILGAGKYFYSCYNEEGFNPLSIYNNNVSYMTFKEDIDGDDNKIFDFLSKAFDGNLVSAELDEIYLSVNDDLVISSKRYDDDGNFLLYFPEINKQKFSAKITGLQPISTSEVAIFLPTEVWFSKLTELGYSYTKSKLQVGLREGADVITSYDGTQVIFPTERGLVALTYQNFVASTDQTLNFLSDAIHSKFIKFTEGPVKLLRYQYWIICYRTDSKESFVFDLRNASWWPMEIFSTVNKALDIDNKIVVLANNQRLHKLDMSDDNYFDLSETKQLIDWYLTSQKLHFNAINNVKHLANITLMSVLDTDNDVSFKMKVNNYRKRMDTTEVQTSEYKVDVIRTFVQRMSFPKVNEFQYTLLSDDEQAIRVPLSLSGLTIKYRIGSQVR